MSIKYKAKTPILRVNAREHFWVKGLKKGFDLSGISLITEHVSDNLEEIPRYTDIEIDIGIATIVYSVDRNNTIHLITGWAGSREKVA